MELLGIFAFLGAMLLAYAVIWVYENLGDDIAHYIKTRARAFLRKDEK